MEWFSSLSPVLQGLTATIFTWAVTALGAALVFFFKNVDRKILNSMLGFGAGVMTAASFWSLLNPAIELCGELGYSQFMLPAIGFFAGGVFIIFADMLMDKYSYGVIPVNNNSLETSKSTITKMIREDSNYLTIYDRPITIKDMISEIKEKEPQFVVIDYLQLIGFYKSKCLSRNKELELIKEDLKKLAKELNIKIVVTSICR